MTMRILVVSERYPPHYQGGYEIACAAVVDELRRQGVHVEVLTSNFGLDGGTRVEGHVHRLLHRPQDSSSLGSQALWEVMDRRVLRRILRTVDPQVIYAWSTSQLFASLHRILRDARAPVVYELQDVWLPAQLHRAAALRDAWCRPSGSLLRRTAKAVITFLVRTVDHQWLDPVTVKDIDLSRVVFCSAFQRQRHIGAGLPLADSRVIYNGLPLSQFTPADDRPTDGPLRCVFVGRLVPEKGAHIAVGAVAALTQAGINVRLQVAGVPAYPTSYAEDLRDIVDANGLGKVVTLLGQVPNPLLPAIYRAADVLLFPSSHLEGLPMTIIEAMACGLAVVATPSGGSAEILADGRNAILIESLEVPDWASAVDRLAKDRGEVRRLGREGRRWVVEHCDIRAVAHETAEYLAAARL